MKVFSNYALYYDLLNQGKDYKQEVEYISSLIKKYAPGTKNILDMGCGTGRHAIHFAEKGYQVRGIDQSDEMIELAIEHLSNKPELEKLINYSVGDVRTFKIDRTFETAVSLFHVMSYQNTNVDINNTLKNVSQHLRSNSIYIFDCWYGPAVLSDKPYVRTKKFENDEFIIKRTAHPELHPSKNIVDVNFDLKITNKITGKSSEFNELHKMRYLFEPEMELMLDNNGFDLLETEEWLTGKNPDFDSWYVTFICKKR